MTTVRVKENEPFEVALRRFKRTVEKTGLLTELRARECRRREAHAQASALAAAAAETVLISTVRVAEGCRGLASHPFVFCAARFIPEIGYVPA